MTDNVPSSPPSPSESASPSDDNPRVDGKPKFKWATQLSSLLCYFFPPLPVTSIAFIFAEKENQDIRFHAWQGTVLGGVFLGSLFLVKLTEKFFRFINIAFIAEMIGLLTYVVWVALIGVWILCIVKIIVGQRWKIPYIGDFAESRLHMDKK